MIMCRALSYEENTLDKSRLRKKSWKSMPVSMDTVISNSMLMMASQVRPLLMCDKEAIEV